MKKLLMYKKGIGILILSSVFIQLVNGQSSDPGVLGKVTISSPNAAGLAKYIDVPVNNHTGIPSVAIPVYTLQEGPISLPISLSYHASGLKLDELASWVGTGWSLNAGGVITRTVRGTPDECSVAEFSKNEKGYLGHNGYNNYLFYNDFSSPLPSGDVAWPNDFSYGIKDGEPDLYFFNFNGHSGKFYFNDDGRPVIVPESDYKIDYEYNHASGPGSPESIQKFIITATDGTKYYFGKTDATNDTDPVEKTHNYYTDQFGDLQTGTNNTIASWFLNRIQTADGLFSISLTYAAEQYAYRTISGVPRRSDNYNYSTPGANWTQQDHWVQGVRLSSITTGSNNSTVTFEPGTAREDLNEWNTAGTFIDAVNTNSKSLGAIQVTNNSGLCKKYKLTYSYFTSDAAGFPGTQAFTDQKRLKLDQLKEENCDGTVTVPAHIFEYFTEAVPRRLSFAKDHWGFINGKTTNLSLTPAYIEKLAPNGLLREVEGADRDSYWPAMRAGSLKKITYPTGGYTEFEFEANTTFLSYTSYQKVHRYMFSAGYDGNSNPVYQTYSFTSNPYYIKLTNEPTGGQATFDGPSMYTFADPGQVVYNQGLPGAGNHQVSLRKNYAQSGKGARVDIYEWVPTQVSENRIVGGLRIKKIIHSDAINTPALATEFSYNESTGYSSGHLYSRPTYVQFIRNDFLRDAGMYITSTSSPAYCSPEGFEYCATNGIQVGGIYLISPNSLRPLETTQGNHIGYNEVKVFSANNGYSVYRYYGSNKWDNNTKDVATRIIDVGYVIGSEIPNFPEAPAPTDYKRGELKYESQFNQAGQLLKDVDYYYDFVENPLKTPGLLTGSGISLAGLPTYYELSTARRSKTTAQQRVYQPGGGYLESTSENFFESSFHNQVTRKVETNSKGEQMENLYKYSTDFQTATCTGIDNGLSTYLSSCATCLSQYYQARASSGHNIPYWKYWDYQALLKCKSLARISFFTARKNYFNPSVSGSYANCMANLKATANADLKPILEMQDRFIVSPIEVVSKKNGNLLGASFTKYDYSVSLPAMVYPVKSQKINLSAGSPVFTPAIVNGTGLTKDSRYEDETNVKVENGTIVEVSGKDGIINSYLWGYNSTLPIAKATGVNYATLLAAYNAVSGNLSLLRTHASLSNAFVSTYTYTPGVGMTSETDPRGRTTYYEYDKLNRLALVKDHESKILKKICYNYAGQPENCLAPCTNTTADWQNIGNPVCQVLLNTDVNTGYQLQQQQDFNPCSPTFNQLQTVSIYNPTVCPPPSCNSNTCTGNDKKCVNGVCETGIWVVISSTRPTKNDPWTCVWAYCFSDGSTSTYTQTTTSSTMCPIGCF